MNAIATTCTALADFLAPYAVKLAVYAALFLLLLAAVAAVAPTAAFYLGVSAVVALVAVAAFALVIERTC